MCTVRACVGVRARPCVAGREAGAGARARAVALDPPLARGKGGHSSQAHPETCIGPGHTTGLRTRGRRAQLEEVPTGSRTDFKSFDTEKKCKEWEATRYFAES